MSASSMDRRTTTGRQPPNVTMSLFIAFVFVVAVALIASRVSAQQPTFPLRQDGPARTAFVSGAYRTCLEKQRASAANATVTTPVLGAFCLCYGRVLADGITGAEFEALKGGAGIKEGAGLETWRGMSYQTVLTPAELKTGNVIYPYEKAK
jgi:hypothetical protein